MFFNNHFLIVDIIILVALTMENKIPEGWKRVEDEAGHAHYLTRHPQVKISKRSQLENYHRKRRYLEMSLDDLDFGSKRRSKKYSYTSEDFNQVERIVKWQRVSDSSEVGLDKAYPLGDGDDLEDVEDAAVRDQVGLKSDGISGSDGLKERNDDSFPSDSELCPAKDDPNWQWRNESNEEQVDISCDVTNDVECELDEDQNLQKSSCESEKKKSEKELERKEARLE